MFISLSVYVYVSLFVSHFLSLSFYTSLSILVSPSICVASLSVSIALHGSIESNRVSPTFTNLLQIMVASYQAAFFECCTLISSYFWQRCGGQHKMECRLALTPVLSLSHFILFKFGYGSDGIENGPY